MGSGKTSVGKILSKKLNKPFIDTDSIIEKETGYKIKDIFKIFSEKYFRFLENNLIDNIAKEQSSFVIATGGGLPFYLKDKKKLKKLGKIIFLKNSKKTLINRIINDSNRPLRFQANLFEQRQYCYESIADIVLSCDFISLDQLADNILLRIKNKELL